MGELIRVNMTHKDLNALPAIERHKYISEHFPATRNSLANRTSVFGVGVNDAIYVVQPKVLGVQVSCPAYRSWKDMLRRAYCKKSRVNIPTYEGVTVCSEWLSFSGYLSWWLDNYVDGWDVDKDLTGWSKQYSPSNCVFVPSWLNCFTLGHGAMRGNYLIGVTYSKKDGLFSARCNNHITRRCENIGCFRMEYAAHKAWRNRKIELAFQVKDLMDAIDKRIYFHVIEIIGVAV